MKTLQKLFLLSVLGLGVLVHEIQADTDTDHQIHTIVHQALSNKKIDMQTLPGILNTIKSNTLALIANKPEYANFCKALTDLNTNSIIAAYMQMGKVIEHAPTSTKSLIKNKLKEYGFAC